MTLRKFMPLKTYVLKNIVNQQLTFSDPKNFNDPYDACLLHDIDFLSALNEEEREFLKSIRIACLFQIPKSSARNDKDKYTREESLRYLWSFYGDSHKGICVEFELPEAELKKKSNERGKFYDFTITEGSFDKVSHCFFSGQVEYKRDILNHIKYIKNATDRTNFREILKQCVFLKDMIFIHEDEYRFITVCSEHDKDKSFLAFPIAEYSGKKIIFGNKCDIEMKKLINEYAKRDYQIFDTNDEMREILYGKN